MEVYEASSMSKALSETSKGLRCYSSIIFRFIFDMSFFQEASIHLTKALSFRILHLVNLRLSNLGLGITKLVICFSLLLALLDNHVTLERFHEDRFSFLLLGERSVVTSGIAVT